jgi:hypothetical protein
MAKTIAPLLSFDGSGAIAKTQVYSRWRGIPYVRRYVIPSNPRTTAQSERRQVFALLQASWKFMAAGARAPWDASAQGRPFLGVNKYTGDNMRLLAPAQPAPVPADMEDFVGSPGALGGPAPSTVTPTPAATTLTFAMAAPALPAGWTIIGAHGLLMRDQAPDAPWLGVIQYQEDLTSTYSLVFTGLVTATDYVVAVWFSYLRPDGKTAYSVGVTSIETTS